MPVKKLDVDSATYTGKAVANWFLRKFSMQQRDCTQLQINKLVYIAHGWNLGCAPDGGPLIDEPVIAWKFGPVIPSLRDEFKEYGSLPISDLAHDPNGYAPSLPDSVEEWQKAMLDWVWRNYGQYTGGQLISITHKEGTPWADVTKNGTDIGFNKIIPNDLIRDYYRVLFAKLRCE